MPRHLLCLYFETAAAINGLDIDGLEEKRPTLLEACDLFAIQHMPKNHKKHVRDLILNNETYSDDQWHEIADYNRDDVLLTILLLEASHRPSTYRRLYSVAVTPPRSSTWKRGDSDLDAPTWPRSVNNGRRCGCSISGATIRSAFTTMPDHSRRTGLRHS